MVSLQPVPASSSAAPPPRASSAAVAAGQNGPVKAPARSSTENRSVFDFDWDGDVYAYEDFLGMGWDGCSPCSSAETGQIAAQTRSKPSAPPVRSQPSAPPVLPPSASSSAAPRQKAAPHQVHDPAPPLKKTRSISFNKVTIIHS